VVRQDVPCVNATFDVFAEFIVKRQSVAKLTRRQGEEALPFRLRACELLHVLASYRGELPAHAAESNHGLLKPLCLGHGLAIERENICTRR
jgi:hypothetical protein